MASKWKDLVDMSYKKDKSGTGGQTIEEKTASWKFYGMMSFIKPYIAGRKLVDVLLQKIF